MKEKITYPELLDTSFEFLDEDLDDSQNIDVNSRALANNHLSLEKTKMIFHDQNNMERKMCEWMIDLGDKNMSTDDLEENMNICQTYTIDYNFLKHGITSAMINQAIQYHDIINDDSIIADIEETEELKNSLSGII